MTTEVVLGPIYGGGASCIQVQTTVSIDRGIVDATSLVLPAAAHLSVDPITGRKHLTVFGDDGHGNGDLICEIPLD